MRLIQSLVVVTLLSTLGCATARVGAASAAPPVDPRASQHLAELLQLRTDEPGAEPAVRGWLVKTYPAFMARAQREDFPEATTFTWEGSQPDAGPVVLMAHLDTVPVEPDVAWTVPPYAGEQRDGFIWGRGALDDKGQAVAMLEALEALAQAGFSPRQPLVLSLGFDEERGGPQGGALVAEAFERRGVVPSFVLDEGLMPTTGVAPDLEEPLALIGTAEKGSLTVELAASLPGGHSSMPPSQSAMGLVARAVLQLETHQVEPRLIPSVRAMLTELAPHLPLGRRLALQNPWLLEGPVMRQLLETNTSAAALRTSTALATFHAGGRDNVLATSAEAHVNFRLLPGDSLASVLAHVTQVVGDERVRVRAVGLDDREPSPESSAEGAEWEALRGAVREAFPQAVVSPGLVLAGTDSRHFARRCPHVYRFTPFLLTKADLPRIHGVDERLSEVELARGVAFYRRLVEALATPAR